MKLFKSDGRYKFHNLGLHYIVEFRWQNQDDRVQYSKLLKYFKDVYGPDKEKVYDINPGLGRWVANTNWRCEQNLAAKRRRIYLREESALTLALLSIENA
jgi:hypothetical protein